MSNDMMKFHEIPCVLLCFCNWRDPHPCRFSVLRARCVHRGWGLWGYQFAFFSKTAAAAEPLNRQVIGEDKDWAVLGGMELKKFFRQHSYVNSL